MGKGPGFGLAFWASLFSLEQVWQSKVLDAAGFDPRICPACGESTNWGYNQMGGHYYCDCFDRPSPRASIVLSAMREAKGEFQIEILFQGGLVASFYQGRKGRTVWAFEQNISPFATESDLPETPEDLKVVYPSWWPHDALEKYDQDYPALAQVTLDGLLTEAQGLQLVICQECKSSLCPGRKTGGKCDSPDMHISWQIMVLEATIAREKERLAEKNKALAAKVAKQQVLAQALAEKGFYKGLKPEGVAVPEGVIQVINSSNGHKTRFVFLVSGSIAFGQLVAAAKEYDNSTLVDEGQKCLLKTFNPGIWIGKGGVTVKALGKAIGRHIEVIKMERAPTLPPKSLTPQEFAPMTPHFGSQARPPFDLASRFKDGIREIKFKIDDTAFSFTVEVNPRNFAEAKVLKVEFPRKLTPAEFNKIHAHLSFGWKSIAEALKEHLGLG